MVGDSLCGDNDDFDWDSEDEKEIENFASSSSSSLRLPHLETRSSSLEASSSVEFIFWFQNDRSFCKKWGFPEKMVAEAIQENCKGEEDEDSILETLLKYSTSSSASSSGSKLFDRFVGMGFEEKMVAKAIQENGEGDADSLLETLLTYAAIGKSPREQPNNDADHLSSEHEGSFLDDFSDVDSADNEVITKTVSDEDNKLAFLRRMGYKEADASIAITRCGTEATISELADFICAAQIAKAEDAFFTEDEPKKPKHLDKQKKRSFLESDMSEKKRQKGLENGDDEGVRLPNPMIGFGVPTEPGIVTCRTLSEAAMGPPFFYYENVALAPKRGLADNFKVFVRCGARICGFQTCIASAKLTERIRKALEAYEGEPPSHVQKYVMDECRKWNLVWVGRNKLAPLEADEVEMLLGFPRNHTRGGGISRTDRYKSLGNSFQVDTVAYHLSSLKDLFPGGINLLSLFSGIGGAEVALHRLGIRLKNVVSVEISNVNRSIMSCWWEQTNQTGNLIHIEDVQHLTADRLEHLMSMYGSFDLVVGGSPCNNLAGSNRHHRDGLEGKESSLFFDYCRILDVVKNLTSRYS
ncbi:DNA CYTOSINE-5- -METHYLTRANSFERASE 3-RELATED [Salix koriyanagi]|uniref:DNA (cytosine-5-)-methyltransferase n=1 Tax=Salix koriyanagi TaxID=2511006 RepID=A0A9Q1ALT4_9ROSI|nr:DNA CYTOSINE-5- -METHYLTRANSFERASE 3-RELATED [Salix koriyanagi]